MKHTHCYNCVIKFLSAHILQRGKGLSDYQGRELYSLHEMACIRRYNEPVYLMCTERYTDVYGSFGIRSV